MTRFHTVLILLIGLSVSVPVLLFGVLWFRADSLPPDEALEKLMKGNTVLVDVREDNEYNKTHISEAVNLPFSKLISAKSPNDLAAKYNGKDLLIICESGLRSLLAANKLQHNKYGVYNITGGIQNWKSLRNVDSPYLLLENANGEKAGFPHQKSSLAGQWAVSLTAFGVKPIYMLLSLIIIIVLISYKQSDIVALRRAMIYFLAGEAACSVNFLFFNDGSYLIEYLHSIGMVLSFGLVVFALMYGLDKRIIRFTENDKKCALIQSCGNCYKHADFKCRIRQVFLFIIPCLVLLAFLPLLTGIHSVSFQSEILGTDYQYIHPNLYQLFEKKYAPFFAVIFFIIGFIILKINKKEAFLRAKIYVSCGAGLLAFSYFRTFLFETYTDNMAWFLAGEEILEFIYVFGAIYTLCIFRRKLFIRS